MILDADVIDTLSAVTTATIMLKNGLRNVWMGGTRSLRPDQPRLVGRGHLKRHAQRAKA